MKITRIEIYPVTSPTVFAREAHPPAIEKIVADFEIQTVGERNHLSPTAASAVLDSLYDIMGKATNLPVYNLVGGAVRKRAGLARTLGVSTPEEMAEEALSFKEQGYKMLTIKVGEGPGREILTSRRSQSGEATSCHLPQPNWAAAECAGPCRPAVTHRRMRPSPAPPQTPICAVRRST